jgi:von Willebrand factor type A domain
MGLAWGWYLLSPRWNGLLGGEAEPKPYGTVNKSVILMTDGEFNTSHLNGPVDATSFAQATALCNNIKNEAVTLYTIGFALNDVTATDFLEDCASDVDGTKQFYLASDGAALKAAFREIVGKIQSLRLTD